MSFGRYQFLSWARRGVARHISERDTLGQSNGAVDVRASLPLSVKLLSGGAPESHTLALMGPGDITGIHRSAIIRTEPLRGVTNYEPNLLPYIEFYDEDFPYRYTPAAPAKRRRHLRPWIALVVLKETEYVRTNRREPLPSIRIIDDSVLPPANELHLWSHVHSNLPHEESDFEEFLDGLSEDVKTDPDGVYSRLLCPRKLEMGTAYKAFLIPSYETGRRAGLGQPILGIKAQTPAWPGPGTEFPVYYQWDFRTGNNIDFEYLVKQLVPRIMDDKVGVREIDCSRPAFVRADDPGEVRPPVPNILMLGGAVMAPNARVSEFPSPSFAQPFLEDLEKLVNLNSGAIEKLDEDPFVTVPFYGMNHAIRRHASLPGRRIVPHFDPGSDSWYNNLNRDPIYRVPAGFGRRVVQENQDKFVDQAWKQLSDVLEANKKINLAKFAVETIGSAFNKTFGVMTNENFIGLAKPLGARVLDGGTTVKAKVEASAIPDATVDGAFARMTRSNTALVKGINSRQSSPSKVSYKSLIRKTNKSSGLSGERPARFKTIQELDGKTSFHSPTTASGVKVWSAQSNLDAEFVFNSASFDGGLPSITKWSQRFTIADISRPLPGTVTSPGPLLPGPRGRRPPVALPPTVGGGPSLARFRTHMITANVANNLATTSAHNRSVQKAYGDINKRFGFSSAERDRPLLNIGNIRSAYETRINPANSYRKLIQDSVLWPRGTKIPTNNVFLPAMAYPDLPQPTYQHLVNVDKEFLLPNLGLVPNNTLSLLKTNQKFIESYLIGLNHEMGRELMWREYPTDMRGSYFRQFWDVNGFVTPNTTAKNAESLKDIKPIHTWVQESLLGTHNHRDPGNDSEKLIFIIRGDLLRKFPNAVIFAQKAIKHSDDAKRTAIRVGEMTGAQFEKEVRFPLYQARIDPDVKLFGFDLTVQQASGQETTPGFSDKRGWYFVLAEVPGEPRFGMDVSFKPNVQTNLNWNDLSWQNFDINTRFIRPSEAPTPGQWPSSPSWAHSSSDMAAILLQRPVMVAIHATEMLGIKVVPELDFMESGTLLKFVSDLGFTFR